jgi:hypothetical protein
MKSELFSVLFILSSLFTVGARAEDKPVITCAGYYHGGNVTNGEPIQILSNHKELLHGDLVLLFESYLISNGQNNLYPLEYRFVRSEESEGQKKYYYFSINQFGKPDVANPDRVLVISSEGKALFYNISEKELVGVTSKLICK